MRGLLSEVRPLISAVFGLDTILGWDTAPEKNKTKNNPM